MENLEQIDYFKIKHNKIKPEKGKILISEPFTQDPYFKRSVVLLTEHNDEGTIGFVLNKPLEISLQSLLTDFPDFEVNISVGGPVGNDTIHFIHTLGEKIPNSIEITPHLFWGGSFEILKILIESGNINNNEIRFFLGYSGWSENQLNQELKDNYWLVTQLDTPTIMTTYTSEMWQLALQKVGNEYRMWNNVPENPIMN